MSTIKCRNCQEPLDKIVQTSELPFSNKSEVPDKTINNSDDDDLNRYESEFYHLDCWIDIHINNYIKENNLKRVFRSCFKNIFPINLNLDLDCKWPGILGELIDKKSQVVLKIKPSKIIISYDFAFAKSLKWKYSDINNGNNDNCKRYYYNKSESVTTIEVIQNRFFYELYFASPYNGNYILVGILIKC